MARMKRKTKQAVGYCRVSSIGQQRNGTGLDRQEEIIAEYARQNNYELIEVYHEAMTGTDTDRPMFTQMLADILSNGHRVIIVERLDRLAREGAFFELAYTQCAVCGPARTSILTGRSIENSNVRTNQDATNNVEVAHKTLEKILSAQG